MGDAHAFGRRVSSRVGGVTRGSADRVRASARELVLRFALGLANGLGGLASDSSEEAGEHQQEGDSDLEEREAYDSRSGREGGADDERDGSTEPERLTVAGYPALL